MRNPLSNGWCRLARWLPRMPTSRGVARRVMPPSIETPKRNFASPVIAPLAPIEQHTPAFTVVIGQRLQAGADPVTATTMGARRRLYRLILAGLTMRQPTIPCMARMWA